jgi:hypothetical protein
MIFSRAPLIRPWTTALILRTPDHNSTGFWRFFPRMGAIGRKQSTRAEERRPEAARHLAEGSGKNRMFFDRLVGYTPVAPA